MLSLEGSVVFVRRSRLSRGKLIHKGTKLGITVEPKKVRLITTAHHSYVWQIVPEKEHSFEKEILRKQLSKHSTGAYRYLYRAVGDSLEAVLATGSQPETSIAEVSGPLST